MDLRATRLQVVVQLNEMLIERLELAVTLAHVLARPLQKRVKLVQLPWLSIGYALVLMRRLLMRASNTVTANRNLFFFFFS
jgi:hypothetical protein